MSRPAAAPHPCEAPGCDRDARMRAPWCNKHRQRARKHGDPSHERWGTVAERVNAKVIRTESCWIWTGAKGDGYGQVWENGRMVGVHRWMYEQAYGPIAEGLVIDHLCRTPACCNPAHLEPVTQAENVRRGMRGVLKETNHAAA